MKKLYELKETLCEELEGYAGRKLTGGSLEEIDKLAHAIKNICKVIESAEEEQYSEASYRRGSSRAGGSYAQAGGGSSRGSYAEAGGSYETSGGASGRGSYAESGGSYARGRGRGARRDSMGRYSRDDEMMAELRKLHGMANDEMQRESIEHIMDICVTM